MQHAKIDESLSVLSNTIKYTCNTTEQVTSQGVAILYIFFVSSTTISPSPHRFRMKDLLVSIPALSTDVSSQVG